MLKVSGRIEGPDPAKFAELENSPAQDYDSDPKFIDFTFSNTAPGTTETLFVQFIGQGGEKKVYQTIITYQPPATPSPVPTGVQPPKDISNIRSITFYTFPYGFGTTGTDKGRLLRELTEAASKIKAAGFNTVWLVAPRNDLNPPPAYDPLKGPDPFIRQYNDVAFNELREALSILKQNNLRAIIPLSYGGEYFTRRYCPYNDIYYPYSTEQKDAQGNTVRDSQGNPVMAPDFSKPLHDSRVDPVNGGHDHYPAFFDFQKELLRRIADYNDMVYVSVFTESLWEVCGEYNAKSTAAVARSTLGNFPNQLPDDLKGKFTIGIHDSGIGERWYEGTSPIQDPNPFDFISSAYYTDYIDNDGGQDGKRYIDGVSDNSVRVHINSRIANVNSKYPGVPYMFGEAGASFCFPATENDEAKYLSSLVNHITENNLGINVWMWQLLNHPNLVDCKSRDYPITRADGSLNPAGLAVQKLFTPRITQGGVVTSYNPWAVWLLGKNFSRDMVAQLFDQRNSWGGDIPISIKEDDFSGISFSLPANSPPSGCNQNGSCQITVKLKNRSTEALSNEYALTLPKVSSASMVGKVKQAIPQPLKNAGNAVNKVVSKLLPTPKPAAKPAPKPTVKPTPRPTVQETRDNKRKSDLAAIQAALEKYKAKNGKYPVTSWRHSTQGSNWLPGLNTYFSSGKIPQDPVNNGAFYSSGAKHYAYSYYSSPAYGGTPGSWYMLVAALEKPTAFDLSTKCTSPNKTVFNYGRSFAKDAYMVCNK